MSEIIVTSLAVSIASFLLNVKLKFYRVRMHFAKLRKQGLVRFKDSYSADGISDRRKACVAGMELGF